MPEDSVLAYYDGPDLIARVFDALRSEGRVGGLQPDDLAALDEFHPLGRPATLALAELVGLQPGQWVLDVGAGIGGPARTLARRYSAHVTTVDPTERFFALNRILCNRTALTEQITVIKGDARRLPLPDDTFDVAWTQALWQGIEDKPLVAEQILRVLRPGARLAVFEVVAGEGGELHYPLPWADGPEHSFLLRPQELRNLFHAVGFLEESWLEGPEVVENIQQIAATLHGAERGLGLPNVNLKLLLPDIDARMAAFGRNVEEERIGLIQAVLRRES